LMGGFGCSVHANAVRSSPSGSSRCVRSLRRARRASLMSP
jgi:hypothetical protein